MATLILRLDIDPTTKKKNVWVKYESDSDALPSEHDPWIGVLLVPLGAVCLITSLALVAWSSSRSTPAT